MPQLQKRALRSWECWDNPFVSGGKNGRPPLFSSVGRALRAHRLGRFGEFMWLGLRDARISHR